MSQDALITIAILATTFALLIKTKLPPVAVFLGALTLTITFRLAPMTECLKGFANSSVLTIGALYIVAAGMYRTGAVTLLADRLIGRPHSLLVAQLRMLPPVAVGSAFLNNTPLVAMFIPVIRDLARTCRLAASRLYIPLSYSSILGGTCTLIGTSTNLVIAGMVADLLADGEAPAGLRALAMFDPAWVGLPVAVAGIGFIIATSRWLLPDRRGEEERATEHRFFGAEMVVPQNSPLIGKSLTQLGWAQSEGIELSAVFLADGSRVEPRPDLRLIAGHVLAFTGPRQELSNLWTTQGLEPLHKGRPMKSDRFEHRLVETVISRRSAGIGRRIGDLPVPDTPYRLSVVAMSRGGQPVPGRLADVCIEAGDVAIIETDEEFFYVERNETDFSLIKRLTSARLKRWDKAVEAGLITTAMVVTVAMGWLPMFTAALIAAGAMLLTGCLSTRAAGRSVEFSTLIVIASAIGLEAAVTGSGLSDAIADLIGRLGGSTPHAALAAVFLGCILMDTLVTNVASAVFMFPIAMALAGQLGTSALPFAMTVMVGASCSFISPMGYQTNLMVYEPGGYRFTDYVRMGVPLTIVVGAITIALTPLVFPF